MFPAPALSGVRPHPHRVPSPRVPATTSTPLSHAHAVSLGSASNPYLIHSGVGGPTFNHVAQSSTPLPGPGGGPFYGSGAFPVPPQPQGFVAAPRPAGMGASDWPMYPPSHAQVGHGATHTASPAFGSPVPGPVSQGVNPAYLLGPDPSTSSQASGVPSTPAPRGKTPRTTSTSRAPEPNVSFANQARRVIAQELGPRVQAILDADTASRTGEIAAEVRRQIGDDVAGRNAVRAEIWAPPSGGTATRADFPPASEDGYVYVRVREDHLDRWLSVGAQLRQDLESHRRGVEAWQLLADQRLGQLEARLLGPSVGRGGRAPRTPLAPRSANAGGAPDGELELGETRKYVRKLIARLYGLEEDFRAKIKPQDVPYPAEGDPWPTHPPDYVAHAVDLAVARRDLPAIRRSGSASRYPQLRFHWKTHMREGANQPWTDAILQYVVNNRGRFGLPDTVTADILWNQGLDTTFAYYQTEASKREDVNHVAKKQKHGHDSKMRERRDRKLDRRSAAALLHLEPGAVTRTTDRDQVLSLNLMSPEYTDDEDARQLPSSGSRLPKDAPKKRDQLAWRSEPVTAYLHSLDKIKPPPFLLKDSGRVIDWPADKPMKGTIPRCALQRSWAERHQHLVPLLVANVGPFHPAPDALAADRMSFGPDKNREAAVTGTGGVQDATQALTGPHAPQSQTTSAVGAFARLGSMASTPMRSAGPMTPSAEGQAQGVFDGRMASVTQGPTPSSARAGHFPDSPWTPGAAESQPGDLVLPVQASTQVHGDEGWSQSQSQSGNQRVV